MKETESKKLFARAKELLPGGVNSPVRAFGAVGGNPLFVEKAKDAYVWDVDGNRYIDYVASWGPMILGHANPKVIQAVWQAAESGLSFGAPCGLEVELAQLVTRMTGIQMVRMVNSGTEAVMSALRLARAATGRDKIIKFEGCYHGHSDSMLVKAGSGALTAGVPNSAGVTQAVAKDTLTVSYNNLQSVEAVLEANKGEVAAIIVEPVAANMGVVPPGEGFLQGLRDLCDSYGALLIFDEVITGFRLAAGGAQAYFGVQADLLAYGKIIGAGLPVGAYGGRKELMEQIAPAGDVYQAGTLSGNPLAMAAGIAQLSQLEMMSDKLYSRLEAATETLAEGLRHAASQARVSVQVNQVGSLCCVYFTDKPVYSYETAIASDTAKYAAFFHAMLQNGVYLAPAQYEAMFVGDRHTQQILDETIGAVRQAFATPN